MPILALATTAEDVGGATTRNTTAGNFEAGYSTEAIAVSLANDVFPQFVIPHAQASAADTWYHFLFRTSNTGSNWTSSSNDGFWITFYDASRNLVAILDVQDGYVRAGVQAATTVYGSGAQIAQAMLTAVDIRIAVDAGNITMDYYVNGALISTATVANNGRGKPVEAVFAHAGIYATATAASIFYSQIIVTDNEPTIGWKLAERKPAAQGNYNQWSGGFAELSDADSATRATVGTTGQRESWTLASYGGPATPAGGIRGVYAKARPQKGALGPQQMRHFLRMGGVDYDGALQSPDGVSFLMHEWANNPATSAPWATADFASMEAGVLSA